MKKFMLTYGVISGVVIIGSVILSLALSDAGEDFPALEWLGYLVMIVAFSVIFVGIKRYRDQELGGVIKFGTAFKLGLGITLVASLIYVIAWEINLAATDYTFIDEYTASIIEAREAEGLAGTELEKVTAEMEQLKARYNNPLFRLLITFSEIFPVGLLITLIAAGVLRNSKMLPAAQANA